MIKKIIFFFLLSFFFLLPFFLPRSAAPSCCFRRRRPTSHRRPAVARPVVFPFLQRSNRKIKNENRKEGISEKKEERN
ncbi:hypothetical protein V6Z12_D09G099300 [Gossypium hirsutum]